MDDFDAPIPFPPEAYFFNRKLDRYAIVDTPEEETFDRVARLASLMTETPIALVTLLDGERQWFKAHVGLETRETPIEYSFCAHAVGQHDVFMVPDATTDDRFSDNPLVTGDPGIRFYAGAPLQMPDGSPIGTLCVIDRVPRTLSAREQEGLKQLAELVMRELELRRAATTDPLTGAFNRWMMTMMLEREMGRFERTGKPFSLASIDLDYFKAVNDRLGHDAGDSVLTAFVRMAGNHFRQLDMLFRVGGEEFVLLMPETEESSAAVALDRFRQTLEQATIQTAAGTVQMTASIGVTELLLEDQSPSDITGRSDQALYEAKRFGRNGTISFSTLKK